MRKTFAGTVPVLVTVKVRDWDSPASRLENATLLDCGSLIATRAIVEDWLTACESLKYAPVVPLAAMTKPPATAPGRR